MINETWVCIAGDKKLVVRCVGVLTAWEVRQLVAKKFGADPSTLDCTRSKEGVPSGFPVIEVQWTGSDYSHGGTPQGRRLQERALGAEEWTDS